MSMNLENPVAEHHDRALDEHSSRAGLRAVASLEAFKGILVIVLGIFLVIYHSRADEVTENLLDHLHVDTDARFGHMIMDAANKLSDARIWPIAAIALAYSSVRFIEAWGLWNRRVWAEWFALLSGAMYLPFELAKVAERATWDRISLLAINLVIVLYMLYIRIRERKFSDA